MPDRILKLYAQEHSMWLRSINYMEEEIIFLKNSLSWMVDSVHSSEVLSWAENYQSRMLQKEEALDFIRNDLHKQEELLHSNTHALAENLTEYQSVLRNKIEYLEYEFLQLKKSFTEGFAAHLS